MPQTLNRLHLLTQGANSASGLSPSQLAGNSWPMQDGKSLEREARKGRNLLSKYLRVQQSRGARHMGSLALWAQPGDQTMPANKPCNTWGSMRGAAAEENTEEKHQAHFSFRISPFFSPWKSNWIFFGPILSNPRGGSSTASCLLSLYGKNPWAECGDGQRHAKMSTIISALIELGLTH